MDNKENLKKATTIQHKEMPTPALKDTLKQEKEQEIRHPMILKALEKWQKENK